MQIQYFYSILFIELVNDNFICRYGKEWSYGKLISEAYDIISVQDLAKQIAAVASQQEITGIINCCSGQPVSLADKVESFIKENGYDITLKYGAFPDRPYDSPAIWGDSTKIEQIMKHAQA